MASTLRKAALAVAAVVWIVVSLLRWSGWLWTVRIGSPIVAILVNIGTVVAITGGPCLLLLLLRWHLNAPLAKALVGAAAFIPVAAILLVALYAVGFGGLYTLSREPMFALSVGTSDIRIERSDCGVGCPSTIHVVQDRTVMPGVRLTRDVAYFYPADEANYRVIDRDVLEVAVTSFEELDVPPRRQRIELRPWVIF